MGVRHGRIHGPEDGSAAPRLTPTPRWQCSVQLAYPSRYNCWSFISSLAVILPFDRVCSVGAPPSGLVIHITPLQNSDWELVQVGQPCDRQTAAIKSWFLLPLQPSSTQRRSATAWQIHRQKLAANHWTESKVPNRGVREG